MNWQKDLFGDLYLVNNAGHQVAGIRRGDSKGSGWSWWVMVRRLEGGRRRVQGWAPDVKEARARINERLVW